jgi:ribonuclease HI/uncharacterized protein YjgD (DUF1641 family)
MTNTPSVLNWNMRGYYTNINELKVIVNDFIPTFITLQETKLKQNNINFNNYTTYIKNKTCFQDVIASGGVMTLINKNVHSKSLLLDTNLQALAVQITYPTDFILCNIYLDHGHTTDFLKDELNKLIGQLGHSFLLTGDFNAHSTLWGSYKTDRRGKLIQEITEQHTLTILNEGLPTHIASSNGRLSAIDLSICTPNLTHLTEWTVLDDLHSSDHFPIVISFPYTRYHKTQRETFDIKKTDWNKFTQNLDFHNINDTNVNDMTQDFTNRIIQAAAISIPIKKGFKGKKKLPFWNNNIKNKIIERKKTIREYKRTLSTELRHKISKLSEEIRQDMQQAKTESWRQYTSTINHKATSKEIYDKIKTLNGKGKHTEIRKIIDNNGNSTTDQTDIANIIKETFEHIYSDNNLSTELRNIKTTSQAHTHLPSDTTNEPYNDNITLKELEEALSQCKGSSPGHDQVHYEMLQHLNQQGKQTLIKLYNKVIDTEVPITWRHSTIIPIKKPGKDPRHSTSYRPIALTSCLCKLLEKIINRRIIWTLDNKNARNKYQTGFTQGKSTTDNITYIVDEIQKNFVAQKQTTAIFIDLKNAYDRVWTHKVTEHLITLGFKGRILKYIQSFLTDRTFTIQLGNIESDIGHMQNGIPQGSVLSCTLFNIVFDNILNQIQAPTKFCAYADDLVLFLDGKDTNVIQEQLQKTLTDTNKRLNMNGLEISIDKTKTIHFTRQRKTNINLPTLIINNRNIECVENFKFLGVQLDHKLKWRLHVDQIQARTSKNVNLIKMLSHTTYGADRQTLLRIHDSLTTSIHNYAGTVLTNLTKQQENRLKTIHIKSLKFAIGGFHTTPNTSTQVEAGVLPLKHQRKVQLIKYTCKILSNKNHILIESLLDETKDNIYKKVKNPPISFSMRQETNKLNIKKDTKIQQMYNYEIPPWRRKKIKVDLTMTNFDKNNTPHSVMTQTFYEKLDKYKQKRFKTLYTDGSKTNSEYGAALVTETDVYRYKCHDYCTVYTTEVFALSQAIKHAGTNKTLICSDSLSAIKALKNTQNNNPLIKQLQDKLSDNNTDITIMWIPSHIGITGNEQADQQAKLATSETLHDDFHIITHDITKHIKDNIKEQWQQEWDSEINSGNKLGQVKKTVDKWKEINSYDRKEQTVITRLRLGHTKLTHLHLIEKRNPPKCSCSNDLTVKHLFECTNYIDSRQKYNINYETLKYDKTDETDKILEYLKEIDLFDKI